MYNLKNTTLEEVLSDLTLKNELKEEYLTELMGFEKENNKDPYNAGQLCTDVILEVKKETPLGLSFLASFIKVAISLDNGGEDLGNFKITKL